MATRNSGVRGATAATATRAARAVVDALDGLPIATEITTPADDSAPLVKLTHHERTSYLLPVWAGQGFPRDVRRALAATHHAPGTTLVITAEQMSPGAVELLREENLTAWVDRTGRAMIDTPDGILVARTEPRAGHARATSPSPEFRWAAGTAATAEYLLSLAAAQGSAREPFTIPSVHVVATQVGLSPSGTSRVMSRFDTQGWTLKSGGKRGATAKRTLADPGAMLSSWAAWAPAREVEDVLAHGLIRDVETYLRTTFAGAFDGYPWAVGGWLAASVGTGALLTSAQSSATVYVDADALGAADVRARLLDAADLSPVTKGERLRLRPAPRHVLAASRWAGSLPCVSPVRVYRDLLDDADRGAVRAREAAEYVRQHEIGF